MHHDSRRRLPLCSIHSARLQIDLHVDCKSSMEENYSHFNLPSCGEQGPFPWFLLQDDLTKQDYQNLCHVMGTFAQLWKDTDSFLQHLFLGLNSHRLIDGVYYTKEMTIVTNVERWTETYDAYRPGMERDLYPPDMSEYERIPNLSPFPVAKDAKLTRLHVININPFTVEFTVDLMVETEISMPYSLFDATSTELGADLTHFRYGTAKSSLLPFSDFVDLLEK